MRRPEGMPERHAPAKTIERQQRAMSRKPTAMRATTVAAPRWRHLRRVLASVLIATGLVTFPTPIPIGAALIAAGCALVLADSRSARRGLLKLRYRYPGFSEQLRRGTRYLPRWMRRVLEHTDPARFQ